MQNGQNFMPQVLNYACLGKRIQIAMHTYQQEYSTLTDVFSDLHPHKTSFITDRKKQNHFIYR